MGKNLEPQFAFRCDKITIQKLEHIAQKNTRTRNQEMKHIIKKYINQYEAEHGEIQIEEQEKKKIKINPLNPLGTGYAAGDALGEMVVEKIKQRRD